MAVAEPLPSGLEIPPGWRGADCRSMGPQIVGKISVDSGTAAKLMKKTTDIIDVCHMNKYLVCF